MDDRRTLLTLVEIAATQGLLRDTARNDLASAVSQEAAYQGEKQDFQDKVDGLHSDLAASLTQSSLDPFVIGAFHAALRNGRALLTQAERRHDESLAKLHAERLRYALSEVRIAKTGSVMRNLKKQAARHKEEDALGLAELRVTFGWVRQ